MTYYRVILVDSSLLIAFYNATDAYHTQVRGFFANCTSDLITTVACVTEVMYFLAFNSRVQNTFLSHLTNGVYSCEHLTTEDFTRIAELNAQYANLPGDFADLSLIAISERLEIAAIATLDKDFDIYRRYRRSPFERVFRP
ncbi:PIN domain-containing protein [Aetokthonos hydrillicola Thurmond2011]|jgi:predicted nucleic acid-binding protein|uniref:PIN domain-containing protein n=1 Tax=Aetokthonos hydrillicola Thurmond2011 TaxID=2712845 RepID=A0AAP5IB11_9CYAN|nr:PIN domain-containing protein [Aetokthonos hydrillicola]MBO3462383.1 PIN domain-containing protein [Aetokthonos hydrillicola CCALA 1050]MBW4590391.1 PIN domain-containing protein [Aetokthonos hydrillicola CCALA 1050]MDR9898193.1 PIN domain-containing protein [Aetokthonos hydrillicola Thurmond2011]